MSPCIWCITSSPTQARGMRLLSWSYSVFQRYADIDRTEGNAQLKQCSAFESNMMWHMEVQSE